MGASLLKDLMSSRRHDTGETNLLLAIKWLMISFNLFLHEQDLQIPITGINKVIKGFPCLNKGFISSIYYNLTDGILKDHIFAALIPL